MVAVLSPRARRDLLEAVRWIAKDNKLAAQGLRAAIVACARRIGEYPEIGSIRTELADDPVRFLPLTGFPYIVVYDRSFRPPLILRVLHGARDIPHVLQAGR